MSPARLWRLLLVSVLAILVVACKPYASFTVTPEPVIAGQVATFDASASVVAPTPRNNAAVAWQWDFGDGSTGAGEIATHTYANAGTYTVKLSVTDKAGRVGTSTDEVVVQAGTTGGTTSLQVSVQIAGGVTLPGARVDIGSVTATTNAEGVATLAEAPVGADQVVKVSHPGYVTQSVRTTLAADGQAQQLLVLLLPEKDTLALSQIEAAQTIASNHLGASVQLPANALVNAATGAPATGPATLKLTPWDIADIDLQAMPGNGRALDAQGNLVDLVSAGMMTVDFFDAAGNKLQLAPGKSAVIQMNLPAGITGIGGNAIAVGTTIPLWHFDESRGLWIGEGSGTVVSTSSGLAVTGTVNHFSTWNWDYVTRPVVVSAVLEGTPPPTPSLTVSCVGANSTPVACNVVATVLYSDGSSRFWRASLPAGGSVIQDMPANTTIHWEATTIDGLKGSGDSLSTGTLVIPIQQPTTRNFVRCTTPGSVASACTVTMTAPLADGSTATTRRYIPETGALITSVLPTTGPLSWEGSTGYVPTGSSTWTRFLGSTTSGVSGDVTIAMDEVLISTDKTIRVSCLPDAFLVAGDTVPLDTCQINVVIYDNNGNNVDLIQVPSGLGGPVSVALPALPNGGWVSINANGTSTLEPSGYPFFGQFSTDFESLTNDQLITIQLRVLMPA